MTEGITLESSARTILDALPCSVLLPAGTGKTELIAAACAVISNTQQNVLILTHTHAGVDAIRARLSKFGVPRERATIRTIDAWCFELVRSYPVLSGMAISPEPDWTQSSAYHRAAACAAASAAMQHVLRCSYQVLFVDEYQDCTFDQHAVVLQIARAVPTAVLGDPMQALFNFQSNPSIDWQRDVVPQFQDVALKVHPWRWQDTNPDLGAWLLGVRADLAAGLGLNLEGAPVNWIKSGGPTAQTRACYALPSKGTVAALGQRRADCVSAASLLGGSYSVMEAIDEKVVTDFCALVDSSGPSEIAVATVRFARSCATNVAKHVPPAKRDALQCGQRMSTRKEQLAAAFESVNVLLQTPSPGNVRIALLALVGMPDVKLYCRDAFSEATTALRCAELDPEIKVVTALSRARNQSRQAGRRPHARVVSRPRLAKGLEFDHVILLDADQYDANELYVALTRGARTLTVISDSKRIRPRR